MPIDFEVTMNEYLPLRDVVFNTLRRAILRGELKPGERLMEIQLANKLGVSRKICGMCSRSGGLWKSWQSSSHARGWTKRN